MQLSAIDLSIIAAYLLSTVVIGLWVRRRAAKDLDAYYLGGRTLPWYMLSLSNASGMFDISGTMWLVTLGFVYGLKSIWIPWIWPVFNQVFLMVYLSAWLRRSNVLTGAEWITTRFGDGPGARASHMVVVIFAVCSVIGFLTYGFVGIGKFIEVFVPWETVAPYLPFTIAAEHGPHVYGILFTSIATFYVMMGGMLGVVWTDLIQFLIMTLAALIIGLIAMNSVPDAMLQAALPEGWDSPFFGWRLDLDWSQTIAEVNAKMASDGYGLFGALVMMMLFKGVLVSAAGPAPNYDMQKILATRSPREAALMSGFVSVVLMPIRYFMVAGFCVLALVYFDRLDLMVGGTLDFENILPAAIVEFVPLGVTGLLLAGLIAAFMSTFASTVNAAPAYLVNDLYRRYINPNASTKRLIYASYAVSAGVVLLSTMIGLYVESINSVLQWLVSGLWGGYAAANVLKWYWWRFNGYGFFGGMASGIVCALAFPPLLGPLFPSVASDILPLYLFPLLLLVSGGTSIAISLLTEPDDLATLTQFYKTVRPWGFWAPIHRLVVAQEPEFQRNQAFRRDMMNVLLGIIAQTALVALPIFIVIKEEFSVALTLVLIALCLGVLKKTWYDKLEC
ncbi:Na+:solute symporter [Sulfidibacter corallicola]|uniref:Na+:solute symporter n=1 Tax=Sulfidibacter corallicola TaxID=2818388 RepID=A0A8A4TPE3_SULCO|nr:sodium:solute symporter family protein [Sulfidibacter corallicola]QTD51839.1 Na+:solute symporter [Sulfidibacter corallicola]